jgi:hypothetical protein
MVETIEIRGVWLVKQPEHLGNGIQVIVETGDGVHHVAISERCDDGPISHYVHPAGIRRSPVREFGREAT